MKAIIRNEATRAPKRAETADMMLGEAVGMFSSASIDDAGSCDAGQNTVSSDSHGGADPRDGVATGLFSSAS